MMRATHIITLSLLHACIAGMSGVHFDLVPCRLDHNTMMTAMHDYPAVGYKIQGKLNTALVDYIVALP